MDSVFLKITRPNIVISICILLQYFSLSNAQVSNVTISGANTNLACGGGLNDTLQDSNSMTGVTLQISNLDTTIEENDLKQYLINRLKPIATVLSIYFETLSVAKIKLPSDHQARQVITYLHRKKIGHKRITVSMSSGLNLDFFLLMHSLL